LRRDPGYHLRLASRGTLLIDQNELMEFSNPPIDLTGVPRLDEADFVPLDPAYLRVSLLGHSIFAGIVLVAGIVASVFVGWIPLAVMGVVLLLVGLSVVHSVVNVRHIAWQVRAHDLSYRSGVLVRTVQTLPFVRIQHARLSRGPIEQRFGLAKLHINSAGPDLSIAGLSVADAERLQTIVIERAGELSEES
jgi:membrane protein YdbS with pleckstrin-like domain